MASKSVIGNLQVRLTAITTQFTKGMGIATRRTRAFSRLMKSDLSKALPLVAGKLAGLGLRGVASGFRLLTSVVRKFAILLSVTLVAAVGGASAALALLTKNAFQSIDKVAKTSRRLGIAIENMAGLTLAAGEAGIEFNQFTLGLQRMTRRISEAAQGMGEAQGALKELNLDAKELAKLSPDEQFLKVADALAEVESQGEKIRLGFKLFDSEGVANILITADAIREASRAAEQLSASISDVDAARIENANDAVGRLKLAFQGVGNTIAIAVAPFVEGLANFMVSKFTEAGTVADLVNRTMARMGPIAEAVINIIGEATLAALRGISTALDATRLAFAELGDQGPSFAEKTLRTFREIVAGTKIIHLAFQEFVVAIAAITLKAFGFVLSKIEAATAIVGGKIADFFEFITGTQLEVQPINFGGFNVERLGDELNRELELMREEAEGIAGKLLLLDAFGDDIIPPELAESLRIVTTEASNLTKEALALLEAFKGDATFADALSSKLKDLEANFTAIGRDAQLAIPDMGDLSAAVEDVADTSDVLKDRVGDMADGIISSLKSGEGAFQSLKNVALSVFDDIGTSLLRSGITSLLGGVFGGPTGFLGGLFGGGSSAPSFAPGPGAFSSLSPIPAPTSGGDVHVNFFGPTSGDDAIKEQVMKGIAEAQPALTNMAVAKTRDTAERNLGFRRAFT